MSSELIHSATPGMSRRPSRAGPLRAVLVDRLARLGQAIWQALEDHGRARSGRELLALAERWAVTHPKLARELRSYVRAGSSY